MADSKKSNVTRRTLLKAGATIPLLGMAAPAVLAQAPLKSPTKILDFMKAQPGKISVATAGVTSAGHNAMELIAKVTDVKYRHVTYDGGNPAVVATVSGEAEVTTQLAVEQADMR